MGTRKGLDMVWPSPIRSTITIMIIVIAQGRIQSWRVDSDTYAASAVLCRSKLQNHGLKGEAVEALMFFIVFEGATERKEQVGRLRPRSGSEDLSMYC